MSDQRYNLAKRAESLLDRYWASEDEKDEAIKKLFGEINSQKDLTLLLQKRFIEFKSQTENSQFEIKHVISSFRKIEGKMTADAYSPYSESKTAEKSFILDRCYTYGKLIKEYSFEEVVITNTLKWVGLDSKPDLALREIGQLFAGLRGLNSKKIFFLSSEIKEQEFINLMTGQAIKTKIVWQKSAQLLIYLMDEIAVYYAVLPDRIEVGLERSHKELVEWLHPIIIDCFVYGKNKSLDEIAITRLRAQSKKEAPMHLEIIKEIIECLKK